MSSSQCDETDYMDWTTKFFMAEPEVQERMIRERERQNRERRLAFEKEDKACRST